MTLPYLIEWSRDRKLLTSVDTECVWLSHSWHKGGTALKEVNDFKFLGTWVNWSEQNLKVRRVLVWKSLFSLIAENAGPWSLPWRRHWMATRVSMITKNIWDIDHLLHQHARTNQINVWEKYWRVCKIHRRWGWLEDFVGRLNWGHNSCIIIFNYLPRSAIQALQSIKMYFQSLSVSLSCQSRRFTAVSSTNMTNLLLLMFGWDGLLSL